MLSTDTANTLALELREMRKQVQEMAELATAHCEGDVVNRLELVRYEIAQAIRKLDEGQNDREAIEQEARELAAEAEAESEELLRERGRQP